MAKIFDTADDVKEFVKDKFSALSNVINFKIMSTTKAKEIIKVSKANATVEFLAQKENVVNIYIYEEAFDRLPELGRNVLADIALSQVLYDGEKDKISVDNAPYKALINVRQTYGDKNVLDILELQDAIISGIEAELREKAQAEKENKKSKGGKY